MIHNVYAIFDGAAQAFLPPFCLRNDNQAIRAFSDCTNSPNHQFNEHPEDYTLFLMGTFCDATGMFTNRDPGPHSLGGGLLHRRKPGPDMFSPIVQPDIPGDPNA